MKPLAVLGILGSLLWMLTLATGLAWAGTPEAQSTEADKGKAEAPAMTAEKAMESEKPISHVGTLVAASLATKTVVVDIPLEKGVLRLGADVTEQTTLTERGKRIALDELQPGDRVRVQFRRGPHGDAATALERLALAGR